MVVDEEMNEDDSMGGGGCKSKLRISVENPNHFISVLVVFVWINCVVVVSSFFVSYREPIGPSRITKVLWIWSDPDRSRRDGWQIESHLRVRSVPPWTTPGSLGSSVSWWTGSWQRCSSDEEPRNSTSTQRHTTEHNAVCLQITETASVPSVPLKHKMIPNKTQHVFVWW